ncbi:MAG: TetR family transcriptional regulator [Beijerinckiaceae bacterium]|jgi:AcrR family transcriptional regulator|nr:TetR family transcriptional regulator [Beijerinckiaceae bacterium]
MANREGKRAPARSNSWTQDPEGVKRNILAAAREAFVELGFAGARVDDIAARTATSKRMIYYYFGDKRSLYVAVLEEAYSGIRGHEQHLDLLAMPPREALARLAGETFDYHAKHPEFVRLVMDENIHYARHIEQSERIQALNLTALATIRTVYDRGMADGVFRAGLEPIDIHVTISALSFYNMSNRATIRALFGHDMGSTDALEKRRAQVIDTVLRFVTA